MECLVYKEAVNSPGMMRSIPVPILQAKLPCGIRPKLVIIDIRKTFRNIGFCPDNDVTSLSVVLLNKVIYGHVLVVFDPFQ
jgi:hypothetical protein